MSTTTPMQSIARFILLRALSAAPGDRLQLVDEAIADVVREIVRQAPLASIEYIQEAIDELAVEIVATAKAITLGGNTIGGA